MPRSIRRSTGAEADLRRSAAFVAGLAVVIAGAALALWRSASDGNATQTQVIAALESIAPPQPDADDDFPAIVDSAVRDVDERAFPTALTIDIVETLTHDSAAFTQGLEISNGALYESTGLVGESTLRELSLESGEVLRSIPVPDVFAEGLTVIEAPDGDTAVQLTWKNQIAYRYDLDTFAVVDTYAYDGQGWGLCHDGDRLVMSDGSATLQFRNADTFAPVSSVEVTYAGVPVESLNELECVDGSVWANIWKSSLIVRIDPSTGAVTGVVNARSLTPVGYEGSSSDVLNGIAYDETDGTFLITGKRWPVIYRVHLR